MKKEPVFEAAVVGAGAAGLMTALCAARRGVGVLLLDGKTRVGAKILMSGGNRCNVTNERVTEKDYESETPRAVRNVLRAFPSEKAVRFFRDLGVELVLEPEGKYFPKTHAAKTVLDALLREAARLNIPLWAGRKIRQITFENGHFRLETPGEAFYARKVVLATGGLSHPSTGSDGSGFALARAFGHSLIPTTPGLTPLLNEEPAWQALRGVSLPCRLTLWVDQKKGIEFEGPLLFTHFGWSGPAALNVSRHWLRLGDRSRVALTADFLPQASDAEWRRRFAAAASAHLTRSLKHHLATLLPERFVETFLESEKMAPEKILNQLGREERDRLVARLRRFPLDATGVYGYEKAEVTSGGIPFEEVDPRTLESKLRPGLYFAGEILDVDGRIGGFNFQWAWSSGWVSAAALASKNL